MLDMLTELFFMLTLSSPMSTIDLKILSKMEYKLEVLFCPIFSEKDVNDAGHSQKNK